MVYMYPCAWSCDSIYEIKLGYHLNCISTSTACTTLDCISVLANLQSMTNSNAHSTQRFLPVPSCLSLSLSSPPSFLFSLLPLISDPLGGRHNPVFTAGPARAHWQPGESMEKPSHPAVCHWGHPARTTRKTGYMMCVCLPICLCVCMCACESVCV